MCWLTLRNLCYKKIWFNCVQQVRIRTLPSFVTRLLENFPHLLNSTTLWQELLVHRVLMDQYLHSNCRGFSRGKPFYSAAILKHIWVLRWADWAIWAVIWNHWTWTEYPVKSEKRNYCLHTGKKENRTG